MTAAVMGERRPQIVTTPCPSRERKGALSLVGMRLEVSSTWGLTRDLKHRSWSVQTQRCREYVLK